MIITSMSRKLFSTTCKIKSQDLRHKGIHEPTRSKAVKRQCLEKPNVDRAMTLIGIPEISLGWTQDEKLETRVFESYFAIDSHGSCSCPLCLNPSTVSFKSPTYLGHTKLAPFLGPSFLCGWCEKQHSWEHLLLRRKLKSPVLLVSKD